MFHQKIRALKDKNLFRELRDRRSSQGSKISFNGKEYINFSSNDYLGLANHPYIITRAKEVLNLYGFGAGASRLLSGGIFLHGELEQRVAAFKETESALVFNSGYAANTGVIPAISDEDTVLFSDEFNHASIIDGCRLSGVKTFVYRHKDMSHLEDLLKKPGAGKKIVITDTIFSMDGDIAPIRELIHLCRIYDAVLYLDEAHATGVIGHGKGVLTHFSISPETWMIQMGTFSKAFGSFGGFIAGSADVVLWAVNSARTFMYSTALPACVIAASLAAIELIEKDNTPIGNLWSNRHKAATGIKESGYDILDSETPIIPVMTGTIDDTMRISLHLLEKGIYAPAIRPPTVKKPRIRINITATHSEEDIGRLIEALREAMR